MNAGVVERPPTDQLTFQAFDKSVHPELIESVATKQFQREGYRLTLHLTAAGHAFEWRRDACTLVELLADQNGALPHQRQVFAHRVGHERSEEFRLGEDVLYRACFQLELVEPGVFRNVCEELRAHAERDGVLQLLHAKDRMGICPLSFVDLQARPGSFIVHAYHTYPEECAIVKTQSLVEFA